MTYRYYLQTMGPKPTLRRYGDDVAEHWDADTKRWSHHCAPEEACCCTGDRIITAAEAEQHTKL